MVFGERGGPLSRVGGCRTVQERRAEALTRKDGGSERGSSALRGAADAMILCEKA